MTLSQKEGFNNGYSAGSFEEYLRKVWTKDGRTTTMTKREKDHEMRARFPRDALIQVLEGRVAKRLD